MTRVARQAEGGRAYLDLQNRARREGRGTQELLTLYVVERWLARLSTSPYADDFVLKGGMLLAAFDARRPTADADALARRLEGDTEAVLARVVEISSRPDDDGVEFWPDSAVARVIREDSMYAGVRVSMDARIATARVKCRVDVNFGDPVTPAPRTVDVPSLRPGLAPISISGYPIETVLAEKLATAISLGAANTRLRDYADVYTLIGKYDLEHSVVRNALLTTAEFRGTVLAPLSAAVGALVPSRSHAYAVYRSSLGVSGEHLPEEFEDVVRDVVTFADPLCEPAVEWPHWSATARNWGVSVRS